MKNRIPELLRKPLAAFRWPLSLLLVGCWIILNYLANTCERQPSYYGVALATASFCIALWVNHLAIAPIRRFQDAMRLVGIALYDFFALVIISTIASIPLWIFTPIYQCYTSRAKVSEVVLAASSHRSVISERFEQTHSLRGIGSGMTVVPAGRVKKGIVTSDGVIVLASDDPPAVVFVTPELIDGKLSWRCSGWPQNIMPMLCRE